MAWDRVRSWFVAWRGGVAVNRIDVAAIWAMLLRLVVRFIGLVSEPAQPGFFLVVVGLLTLFRHHPGGA